MLKFLNTNLFQTSAAIVRCSSNLFAKTMTESLQNIHLAEKKSKKEPYKPRYNGRAKKRNWEDYTDEGQGSEKRANFNPADRVKRKKFCLLLGYSGVNYFGMQRNPEMKTIEEDLLTAMLKNKWITDDSFKQAQNIQFQRAARTDKGVSAARQCVSLKLPDEINIEDLNKDLPEQIRLFAARRVTKGFNSKEKCCARTYTYTIPTVAFANHGDPQEMETFRVPIEKINELNNLLRMFIGTKCFHNFTSRKEYIDPSSKRYIISFECDTPFVGQNDIEFAVLKVKGQSFMLHQIRKMIGLTLAVLRGLTPKETIIRAFTEIRIDIPMAPGLGLVLDQVHYDRYNSRYSADGIHDALTWDAEEPEIKRFFNTYIIPTIVETEIRERSIVTWLETLHYHSYDIRLDSKPSLEIDGESQPKTDRESPQETQSQTKVSPTEAVNSIHVEAEVKLSA